MSFTTHPDGDLTPPTAQTHPEHTALTVLPEEQHTALSFVSPSQHCSVPQCPQLVQLPADGVILAWLDEKTGKSQSWKTHVAYHALAISLRDALQAHGSDLFTDLSDDTRYTSYLLIVQRWAGSRSADSRHKGEISAATYNHRLAAISSLFEYARRMRLYRGDNPIDAIARRKSDPRGAQALDMIEMRKRLARINRQTDAGRRDYALLSVALQTGGRVRAIAQMRVGDLRAAGDRLIIHFRRTKGGEADDRELEAETSKVLIDYLSSVYGEHWQEHKDAPVWISYARNASRGQQLSVQALEQICLRYIGTSKFHALRHTTSMALDDLGVPTSEIQTFLRHKNISTTSTYLKRNQRARNKYGRDLEQVFGIHAQDDVQ